MGPPECKSEELLSAPRKRGERMNAWDELCLLHFFETSAPFFTWKTALFVSIGFVRHFCVLRRNGGRFLQRPSAPLFLPRFGAGDRYYDSGGMERT